MNTPSENHIEYIDITPDWGGIAEIAIALIESGTGEGKREGREIVRNMGRTLDKVLERERARDAEPV